MKVIAMEIEICNNFELTGINIKYILRIVTS